MLDKILDRLRLVDVSSQADADKSLRRMSGPARARPGAALLARCPAEEIQRREQAMLDHVRAGGSLFTTPWTSHRCGPPPAPPSGTRTRPTGLAPFCG